MFANRAQAGVQLAAAVTAWVEGEGLSPSGVVVLGLPRGGVPVAKAVADSLGAPLDVAVVRKLGVPYQPELAMGAIGEGGVRVLNEEVLRLTGVRRSDVETVERKERREMAQRLERLRGHRPGVDLHGKTVVIVDDGIATGATAHAAIDVCRARGAQRVVLAAPVGAADSVAALRRFADHVICLLAPEDFLAVGRWYREFRPVSDDDVRAILDTQHELGSGVDADVDIDAGLRLPAHVRLPPRCRGVVIFAHGSGSGRHSPRNQWVAEQLQGAGIGTVLLDLLSPAEARAHAAVFDIELLAARLEHAREWVHEHPYGHGLPVGYFGASTGAAAALWAAAQPNSDIAAIVSRGGRPDLAGPRLGAVRAPTLLIVGQLDHTVLELNRQAAASLTCPHELVVVPGASHLFEEPGTLAAAAGHAVRWFLAQFPVNHGTVNHGTVNHGTGRD